MKIEESVGSVDPWLLGPGLRMVASVVVLLVLLSHIPCKAHVHNCRFYDLQPPLHKYHQPGDLVIGGIVSQAQIFSDAIAFTEEPPPVFLEELT